MFRLRQSASCMWPVLLVLALSATDALAQGKKAAPKKKTEPPPPIPTRRIEIDKVDPAARSQALASATKIDQFVDKNYSKYNVRPNELTSDDQFVRRAYLDITGTIPTAKEARQFVYDRDPRRIMAKTIFDIATETRRPALAALGHEMLKGSRGMTSTAGWDASETQWVFYAPIESSNWVFASRFPESRVLADVRRRTAWSAAALGLTLLLIVGCVVYVAQRVAAPICDLKDKVMDVAGGHGRRCSRKRIDPPRSPCDDPPLAPRVS